MINLIDLTVIGLVLLAAVWDILWRRVPNALSVSILGFGLLCQLLATNPHSLGLAVAGGAITFALLFSGWSARLIGGGDVKLGTAAAVAVGWSGLAVYLGTTAIAGGVAAAVAYLRSARSARTMMKANLLAVVSGLTVAPVAHTIGRVSVPYGVAIATGAVITLVWR